MEYFVLKQGLDAKPIALKGLSEIQYKQNMTKEEFESLDEVAIAYFKNSENVEILDILMQPTLMVSPTIQKLFQLYDDEMSFKAVQGYSIDLQEKVAPLYWIPDIRTIDCLHLDTKKYNNGLLKELVLDQSKIGSENIYKVGGIVENRIIISLAVAESLLRRELYGIGLEEVVVRR